MREQNTTTYRWKRKPPNATITNFICKALPYSRSSNIIPIVYFQRRFEKDNLLVIFISLLVHQIKIYSVKVTGKSKRKKGLKIEPFLGNIVFYGSLTILNILELVNVLTRNYNVLNINQSGKLKFLFHISNDWLYNGQALPDCCQLSKSYTRVKLCYRLLKNIY